MMGLQDNMKIPPAYTNTDREGQYLLGLKHGRALMDDEIEHHHGLFDVHTHQHSLAISSPFGHNSIMFGPTLELQGNSEQRAKWLPLLKAGKIIGTYAQTELGHGTFVRGLETTATLDQDTDEFVIHSPTLTSTKYWPSALGFSASHAIVMARLIISNMDYGVHAFLVQIRSLENYSNLPGKIFFYMIPAQAIANAGLLLMTPYTGIETGDIGSKIGFNTTDMGYARFDEVRIPRDQMLMGHAVVLRNGEYFKAPHAKLSYSTLLYTRVKIINNTAFQFAQAIVIATRFSVVREQGVGVQTETAKELPIIAYKSQHYRLLTCMAQAYAILFASQLCLEAYSTMQSEQRQGKHSSLPDLHALTAALKAFSTEVALNGAEDARKCCGGFGFSDLSGLPTILGTMAPLPTLEGENHVMYQQAARYLMKAVKMVKDGQKLSAPLAYLGIFDPLRKCQLYTSNDLLDVNNQITMFQHNAARLIFHAAALLDKAENEEGMAYADAWNTHMLSLIRASRAHAQLYALETFAAAIARCHDPATRSTLTNLCGLFALTSIENPAFPSAMTFVEDGYVNIEQLSLIRRGVDTLLCNLLPDIIALGDAWDFTDASLGSAIGMYDGNIYERIMNWTRQLPLNVRARSEGGMHYNGYCTVIKPMLESRL